MPGVSARAFGCASGRSHLNGENSIRALDIDGALFLFVKKAGSARIKNSNGQIKDISEGGCSTRVEEICLDT